MDAGKVGALIRRLRLEKGLTQSQLGALVCVSDKAISKWERGMGCPDISLVRALSARLQVDVEALLAGELAEKPIDGGNMKRIKFYACPACGNILTATGEAEVSCCGRRLAPLEKKPCDEAHQLAIAPVDDETYVTFSHDMTKGHFIRFLAYVRYDRALLVRLYPEQGGEARLPRLHGGSLYVCCSEHGLYERNV